MGSSSDCRSTSLPQRREGCRDCTSLLARKLPQANEKHGCISLEATDSIMLEPLSAACTSSKGSTTEDFILPSTASTKKFSKSLVKYKDLFLPPLSRPPCAQPTSRHKMRSTLFGKVVFTIEIPSGIFSNTFARSG